MRDPIDPSPLVRRCARHLLEHSEELADGMFREIVAQDGRYATLSPELRAEVREFNERNLREQLGCIAEARPVSTETSRQNARRRAAQGVPIDALLHAFRIGYRHVWQAFIDFAKGLDAPHDTPSMDDIAEGTAVIWSLFDACSQTVNEVYRDTLIGMARQDERRRLQLLDALFAGRLAEWAGLGGTPESLGLPGRGPYVAVAAHGTDAGPVERALQRHAAPRSVWYARADGLAGVVALPAPDPSVRRLQGAPDAAVRALQDALDAGPGAPAGLSPAYANLTHTAEGLRLAALARDSLPPGSTASTTIDRDPVAVLVAAGPELAERMVDPVLGPVLRHPDRGTLLAALRTWLDSDGSAADAAARLYCHRNTLRNRLDRITALCGRDPRRPVHAAAFHAALRAHELRTQEPRTQEPRTQEPRTQEPHTQEPHT